MALHRETKHLHIYIYNKHKYMAWHWHWQGRGVSASVFIGGRLTSKTEIWGKEECAQIQS